MGSDRVQISVELETLIFQLLQQTPPNGSPPRLLLYYPSGIPYKTMASG